MAMISFVRRKVFQGREFPLCRSEFTTVSGRVVHRDFPNLCAVYAAKQTGVNMLCTHSAVAEARIFGGRVPEDYKRLVFETFACAFSEAHKRGITVALECANWDAVKNYAEFLELKRYIKSTLGTDEMLKYIGVPCYDSAYENSDDIAMFHMKDKEKDAKFYTCFGKGDADFSEFFKGAKAYGDIPYILEYVTASNAYEISCLLRKYAKEQ